VSVDSSSPFKEILALQSSLKGEKGEAKMTTTEDWDFNSEEEVEEEETREKTPQKNPAHSEAATNTNLITAEDEAASKRAIILAPPLSSQNPCSVKTPTDD